MDGLDFDLDSLLWALVNKFRTAQGNGLDIQDLFSEARVTAYTAIQKYKKQKDAKLQTYIYQCVSNRLKDIYRRKKRNIVDIADAPELSEEDNFEDIQFILTMRGILTSVEFRIFYSMFVESKNVREISEEETMRPGEVRKCVARICAKYLSLEKSQVKFLTQKKLQENWLGGFHA